MRISQIWYLEPKWLRCQILQSPASSELLCCSGLLGPLNVPEICLAPISLFSSRNSMQLSPESRWAEGGPSEVLTPSEWQLARRFQTPSVTPQGIGAQKNKVRLRPEGPDPCTNTVSEGDVQAVWTRIHHRRGCGGKAIYEDLRTLAPREPGTGQVLLKSILV